MSCDLPVCLRRARQEPCAAQRLHPVWVEEAMRAAVLVALVVLAAFTLTGCQAIEGVFKAGVWFGVIGVVLLIGIIAWVVTKASGV